jgi:uncharacterized membrane protein YeiH
VPAFVAAVTGGYPVRDLMVNHPPIEEVVAAFYQMAAPATVAVSPAALASSDASGGQRRN